MAGKHNSSPVPHKRDTDKDFRPSSDATNRLRAQTEGVISEEQARFIAGRSTTEQMFNRRNLYEKYLQHT